MIATQNPSLGTHVRCCRPQHMTRQVWQPIPAVSRCRIRRAAASSRQCITIVQRQESDRPVQSETQHHIGRQTLQISRLFGSAAGMWLITELPALSEETAAVTDFSKGSFSAASYYVTLGLFLLSLPGELHPPSTYPHTHSHCAYYYPLPAATHAFATEVTICSTHSLL